MMNWRFLMLMICFNNLVSAQSYRELQNLKFADSSHSVVLISEFPVYQTASASYVPLKIPYKDFYDYRKTALGIRYFNFGCVKTKKSAYWLGQVAKDKFGHAIFKEPIYGIRAMALLNIEIIEKRNKNTLLQFFNVYAPADDCVGSIRGADGKCLYGYNHPEGYAQKVADALGIRIHDKMLLRDHNGKLNLKLLVTLLNAVAKFETAMNCCITEDTLLKAMSISE